MHRLFLLSLPCFPLASAPIGYDCREYDCVTAFARSPVAAPNPPVPSGAITNESGRAIWIGGFRLHFWDGTTDSMGSSGVMPDFWPYDLSDTDIIAWREGPGSFFLKDARNLDAFSSRLGMVFGPGGYYDLFFADPVHINAAGNAILFRGVQRRDLGDNLIESGLLVAVAWDQSDLFRLVGSRASQFTPTRIPEPSTSALILASGLALAARRAWNRRRTTIGKDALAL